VLSSASFFAVTVAPFTSEAYIEPLIVVDVGISVPVPVLALLHAASAPIEQARNEYRIKLCNSIVTYLPNHGI
jgi:hypothetical protein